MGAIKCGRTIISREPWAGVTIISKCRAGLYGEKDMMTWWSEALGSIVLMDREPFAANKINDAFVVISTDGQSDACQLRESAGRQTNRNGYLLERRVGLLPGQLPH